MTIIIKLSKKISLLIYGFGKKNGSKRFKTCLNFNIKSIYKSSIKRLSLSNRVLLSFSHFFCFSVVFTIIFCFFQQHSPHSDFTMRSKRNRSEWILKHVGTLTDNWADYILTVFTWRYLFIYMLPADRKKIDNRHYLLIMRTFRDASNFQVALRVYEGEFPFVLAESDWFLLMIVKTKLYFRTIN